MAEKKQWDLTSAHSLTGATEWVRKRADALLVLVIRPGDVVFSVDPDLSAMNAVDLIENALPALLEQLVEQRASKTRALRLARQPGDEREVAEDGRSR